MSGGTDVGTLTSTVVPAVIAFNFTPFVRLGDLVVRWETLALALSIIIAIGLTAVIAGRVAAVNESFPEMGGRERGAWHLRRDDLLFILLGVVPGAVVGGRIGYVVIHWDYYSANPGFIVDPGQGSLELGFALLGGTAVGVLVAYVLGAPIGRWLHVATVPVLLGLALGKLAMVLGGSGQGIASDVAWATAYLGQGPWGSLAAETPSHPTQIYEALITLAVLILIGALLLVGRFRDQDGRVYFAAISLWALGRTEAGFLWRDNVVFGPFRAAQFIALLIAVGCFGLFVARVTYTGRTIREILATRARVGRPAMVMDSGGRDTRLGQLDLPPMIPPSPTRAPIPAPGTAMSLERVRGRIASARAGATAARGWLTATPPSEADAVGEPEAGPATQEGGLAARPAVQRQRGYSGGASRARGSGIAAFAAATTIASGPGASGAGSAVAPDLTPIRAEGWDAEVAPAAAGIPEGDEVRVRLAAITGEPVAPLVADLAEQEAEPAPAAASMAAASIVEEQAAMPMAHEPMEEQPIEEEPAEEEPAEEGPAAEELPTLTTAPPVLAPANGPEFVAPWRRRLAPPAPPVPSGWLTPATARPAGKPVSADDLAAAASHGTSSAPSEPARGTPPAPTPEIARPTYRPQAVPPAAATGGGWLRSGAADRAPLDAAAAAASGGSIGEATASAGPDMAGAPVTPDAPARAPYISPIAHPLDREELTSAPPLEPSVADIVGPEVVPAITGQPAILAAAAAASGYDPLAPSFDLFGDLSAPIAPTRGVGAPETPAAPRDVAPTAPSLPRRTTPLRRETPAPRGVPQEIVAAGDALVASEVGDPLAPRVDLFDVLSAAAIPGELPGPVAAPSEDEAPTVEPAAAVTAAPEPELAAGAEPVVEPAAEPEPAEPAIEAEPTLAPAAVTAAAVAVPAAPVAPALPAFESADEAEERRYRPGHRPPHRPVRPPSHREPEPETPVVAVDSTGRPLAQEPELRRRPHVPPRSRREFEERLNAPTEAEPPEWSARGRRLAEDAAAADRRRQAEEAARAEQREQERIEAARRRVARPTMRRRPGDDGSDDA